MAEDSALRPATQSTLQGLTRLSAGIFDLLHEHSLDSRFAAKLCKKLEKEAQSAIEADSAAGSVAQRYALQQALATLRDALTQRDSQHLVETLSRLRQSDTPSVPDTPVPQSA